MIKKYDSYGRLVFYSKSEGHSVIIDYNKKTYVEEYIDTNGIKKYIVTDFDNNIISKGIIKEYTNASGYKVTKWEEEPMEELNTKDKEKLRVEIANLIATGHSYDEIYDALEHVKICSDLNQEAEKLGWEFICTHRKLPIDFIRRHANKIDWKAASVFQNFTEDELREFKDKIDWLSVFLKYDFSKDFLYEFQKEIRNSMMNYMK